MAAKWMHWSWLQSTLGSSAREELVKTSVLALAVREGELLKVQVLRLCTQSSLGLGGRRKE